MDFELSRRFSFETPEACQRGALLLVRTRNYVNTFLEMLTPNAFGMTLVKKRDFLSFVLRHSSVELRYLSKHRSSRLPAPWRGIPETSAVQIVLSDVFPTRDRVESLVGNVSQQARSSRGVAT